MRTRRSGEEEGAVGLSKWQVGSFGNGVVSVVRHGARWETMHRGPRGVS
jgi:hypothetical protein